jgi:hypothetical protein
MSFDSMQERAFAARLAGREQVGDENVIEEFEVPLAPALAWEKAHLVGVVTVGTVIPGQLKPQA